MTVKAPIKGHPRIDPSMVIQRPKVVYAESTGKYNVSAVNSLFSSGLSK